MTKYSLVLIAMLALVLFAGKGIAQQNKPGLGGGYHPQVKYAGSYKANLLFFRYTQNDGWRRQLHMDRLRYVTCQDALDHLNNEGKWQGSLKSDGSCGKSSSESPEWAVGNRINYDESLGQSAN